MSWQNIETAEDKAAKAVEQNRQQAKSVRDQSLASMTYTFPDGAKIQNRPIDAGNIQTAIALGVDRDWLMVDNSKRLTTVAEMQEALNAGIVEAANIWQTYIDTVDTL